MTTTSGHDLHVVLVEPEIPWNTGNAGRTCLAAGARLHLVEPLGFDVDEKAVRRSGLDYWPRVDPRVWPSWERFEAELPSLGEPLFFSAEGATTLWEATIPERSVLVFGRESVGLAPEIRERYRDQTVRLPMVDPELRSLNLSTTVGIVLYEVMRRRKVASG